MRESAGPSVKGQRTVDPLGGGLVALASLQFGGVVVLGKIVTDGGLPVSSFLAVRFAAAALLLAGALGAIRQPLAAAPGEGRRLALLGTAGYAVEAGLFFAALQHGTAPAVTLLFFTYPVLVSLLSVAMGRGLPGRLVVVALLSSVAGAVVVVVAGQGLEIQAAGVLFALGSAVTFSLYLLGADAVLKRTNSLAGSMWVSGSAAAALAVFAVATGTGQWPVGLRQWAPVLGSAAFTAGAFVCLFAGLRRLGAVRTSIVAASEPLSATILAVIFLNEPLRAATVFGGVLILAGAVTASLARRGEPSPAEPPVP
jgi:drug/metabolite transporter (DMT)-like permease